METESSRELRADPSKEKGRAWLFAGAVINFLCCGQLQRKAAERPQRRGSEKKKKKPIFYIVLFSQKG